MAPAPRPAQALGLGHVLTETALVARGCQLQRQPAVRPPAGGLI